jgi:hypothetical protein
VAQQSANSPPGLREPRAAYGRGVAPRLAVGVGAIDAVAQKLGIGISEILRKWIRRPRWTARPGWG